MVLVKRRSDPIPLQSDPTPLSPSLSLPPSYSCASALPYGDGRDSPKVHSRRRQNSFTFGNKTIELPSWALKALVGFGLFLWGISAYWSYQMRSALKELEIHSKIENVQVERAVKALNEAKISQGKFEWRVSELEETKKALEQETRSDVRDELISSDPSISRYIDQREKALQEKVNSLRRYIQEESHREVLEKFGPGPHRVKMTIMLNGETKHIVIEMAPIDMMPHSVHIFLEMVRHELWDNTAFWHHYGATHVVSAAPVVYNTGESRNDHFRHYRLGGVSYSEYSEEYPHKKYTVGFSHRGPGFYINAKDNTRTHAPGGQRHHDLDDEADPCFGKVVEGKEVIDSLRKVTFGVKDEDTNTWFDHTLTHIVKVEIID